jgi:hypothetical protein
MRMTTTNPRDADLAAHLDWTHIATQLDQEGHALLRGFLSHAQVQALLALLPGTPAAGRRVALESLELGRGDLFYFSPPQALPALLQAWRRDFYRHLAPIANRWNQALGDARRYPDTLEAFLLLNREAGQLRALSNFCVLQTQDYQALHQHSEGEHVFALQLVALLGEPGEDFTGGEWVMTEQRPRMQSRPMVLPLRRGDVAVIAVAHRPVESAGGNGYYRVNLKHAVSRVRSGERVGMELLFHDGGAPGTMEVKTSHGGQRSGHPQAAQRPLLPPEDEP